jgi:hypothetical protein
VLVTLFLPRGVVGLGDRFQSKRLVAKVATA